LAASPIRRSRIVTKSLAAFQSDLGRALLGQGPCPIDSHSAGYRFTMQIRRSWRKGRAMLAARTVLLALTPVERERLLDEFLDCGGGLETFLEKEAEHFLAFLEARLPRPSQALTLCHMQQALFQARLGALTFAPPRLRVPTGPVRRGRYAAMIRFHADPGQPMMALNGGEPPPVGPAEHAVLFSPGLPNLFRLATDDEAELWASLPLGDASPTVIAALLAEGAAEYSGDDGAGPC
jgi:hypothetical protein